MLYLYRFRQFAYFENFSYLAMMSSALDEPLYSYVARQRVERSVLYMQTEDMSLQNLIGLVGYDNP